LRRNGWESAETGNGNNHKAAHATKANSFGRIGPHPSVEHVGKRSIMPRLI
jgi:hypothetical protein